jgi:hypothetical protein
MTAQTMLRKGPAIFTEIEEFGSFDEEVQYYIRRSLDVGLSREVDVYRWARGEDEAASLNAQRHLYRVLPLIRASAPEQGSFAAAEDFLLPLIAVSTFDVSSGRLTAFCEYRFLYERLLGPIVRPWLATAFAAAAAMPSLPAHRRAFLLASVVGAVDDHWSAEPPNFYPEWLAIDEVRTNGSHDS